MFSAIRGNNIISLHRVCVCLIIRRDTSVSTLYILNPALPIPLWVFRDRERDSFSKKRYVFLYLYYRLCCRKTTNGLQLYFNCSGNSTQINFLYGSSPITIVTLYVSIISPILLSSHSVALCRVLENDDIGGLVYDSVSLNCLSQNWSHLGPIRVTYGNIE